MRKLNSASVRRVFLLLTIFLVVFGSGRFAGTKEKLAQIKQPQIPQEATATATIAGNTMETVFVSRVIDGDTIEIEGGRRVRYIGINTPEIGDPRQSSDCFGKEAADENKRLVEGRQVRMEKDVSETDKYGRLLRYVYVGDIMVNDLLVRQGFANVSTFPPDVQYTARFVKAQKEAKDANRGLWSGCPRR